MATRFLTRSLLSYPRPAFDAFITRSFSALAVKTAPAPQSLSASSALSLFRLRPLVAVSTFRSASLSVGSTRAFSTHQTTSSISDPNPNWSNRPPKETILLDGCDFEHWLVVVEQPNADLTRDQIIEGYIKTLAQIVGSEDEARKKIYSVSTRHYFAFGALVSEELSYKLKELPAVRWVLPDSYLDVRNKDYGGEPFINGEAVPYDPKYHEEWVRNNARANDRNRRNNRPRGNDNSRNFDRPRRPAGPPTQNGGYAPPNNMGGGMAPNSAPPNNMGGGMAPNSAPPNNMGGGMAPNAQYNHGGSPYQPAPGLNANYPPPNMAPPHQNMGNSAPYQRQQVNSAPYQPQQGNSAPYPPQQGNSAPYPPQQGNSPPQHGMPNNAPNPQQYGNAPPYGGQGHYQSGPGPNAPNMYQNQNIPGRD